VSILSTRWCCLLRLPQRSGVRFPSSRRRVPVLPDQVRHAIDQADCVLAIVTTSTGPEVEKELSYALGINKLIIPIVEEGAVDDSFLKRFRPVFRFSRRDNAGEIEPHVLAFLKQQKLNKDNLQALGALVSIGIGLLPLAGLSKR
jgi:hypothetical protein